MNILGTGYLYLLMVNGLLFTALLCGILWLNSKHHRLILRQQQQIFALLDINHTKLKQIISMCSSYSLEQKLPEVKKEISKVLQQSPLPKQQVNNQQNSLQYQDIAELLNSGKDITSIGEQLNLSDDEKSMLAAVAKVTRGN